LAGPDVDGEQVVLAAARAQGVEPVADDGRGGVAHAGLREGPQQLGAALGPRLEQAGFLGDVVAVRALPLGPVVGAGGAGQQQTDEQGRGHTPYYGSITLAQLSDWLPRTWCC